MKRMLGLSLLLTLCLVLSAQAALPHIADQADTFTAEQERVLQARMEQIWNTYKFDTLIVTTNDSQGLTAASFADEFLVHFREDFLNKYRDGLTFSFNFDLDDYYNSTRGLGKAIFPHNDNTELDKVLRPSFKVKDYNGGMLAFLDYVEQLLRRYSTVDSSGVVTLTSQRKNPGIVEALEETVIPFAPFTGIVSLAIGIGYALFTKRKLLIAAPQSGASAYVRPNSLNFTDASDMFLYQTVVRTKLPENNTRSGGGSSGGGGGYRTSSRGGSFGGSGGKL